MMTIDYSKQAVKFISSQDRPTKQRIKTAIEGLAETPPIGDIKPMKGYQYPVFRLRVGKFRVIYRYDLDTHQQKILYIADVDSRGDIYK